MRNPRIPVYAAIAAYTLAVGCSRDRSQPTLPSTVPTRQEQPQDDEGPTRESETPRGSAHLSDAELWQEIRDAGGSAWIGVKAPGHRRGVWHSRILISEQEVGQARDVLAKHPGVAVVRTLPPLPILAAEFRDSASLVEVRHLPFVDYVEAMPTASASRAMRTDRNPAPPRRSSDGSSGCSAPDLYTDPIAGQTTLGDVMSYSYGRGYDDIVDAWLRTQGDDVRIAILDTGLDLGQQQFMDPARFNPRPAEYTRNLYLMDVMGGGPGDQCGHGTRIAGVIGAPNDGQGTVGEAWKSDIIVVRTDPDPLSASAEHLYDAINDAMLPSRPAQVINMSLWGSSSVSYPVSDLIRYYYYQPTGPVFVASIGTDPLLGGLPDAVYPSELAEVIAVVAIDADGGRDWASHYGPKAELSAYIPQATVDVPALFPGVRGITKIMGSSGAAASISGIAALVRSRYPWMTNVQIRDRLKWASLHPEYKSYDTGYGPVNAYKAVGGFYFLGIVNPGFASPNQTVEVQADPKGDGPFTYQWNNRTTGQTASYTAGASGSTLHVQVTVTDTFEGTSRTAAIDLPVAQKPQKPTYCDPVADPTCA